MFDLYRTKKIAGNVGTAAAVYWYTLQEYIVAIPLTDSQDYDILVEKSGLTFRVTVKTTRFISKSGNYCVSNLSIKGGNQSFNTVKRFDNTKVDVVFILTGNGRMYAIPSKEIGTANAVTITPDREKYYVGTMPIREE